MKNKSDWNFLRIYLREIQKIIKEKITVLQLAALGLLCLLPLTILLARPGLFRDHLEYLLIIYLSYIAGIVIIVIIGVAKAHKKLDALLNLPRIYEILDSEAIEIYRFLLKNECFYEINKKWATLQEIREGLSLEKYGNALSNSEYEKYMSKLEEAGLAMIQRITTINSKLLISLEKPPIEQVQL